MTQSGNDRAQPVQGQDEPLPRAQDLAQPQATGTETFQAVRQAWVGSEQAVSSLTPSSVIGNDVTYEQLLSTHEPFPQRIPLAEMIEFLVEFWIQDGLYDD
ncbi:hypothetical protein WJX74_011091 [Apatococcus lobatus]|uniref:Gag1-like clamp domain-containing protein n=1 Tax=Apatococcus lobatus TaxID=904363 RepID=A0AAW1QAM2_9CHLO